MTSAIVESVFTALSIHQSGTERDVPDPEQKEETGDENEDDVNHWNLPIGHVHRLDGSGVSNRSRSHKEFVKARSAL